MIRVLLAEDQQMMRDALAALLRMEPDIEVVAEVGTGRSALAAALEHRPDVALLDIEMPDGSGLETVAALQDQLPSCRVLILTTFGRPGYLRRAMEAGAQGFLVKDAPLPELTAAIRRALAGEQVVDPVLAATALSVGPNPLTAREREVLAASADGASVADIAVRLHLESRPPGRGQLKIGVLDPRRAPGSWGDPATVVLTPDRPAVGSRPTAR